jgi:hypothetical protein
MVPEAPRDFFVMTRSVEAISGVAYREMTAVFLVNTTDTVGRGMRRGGGEGVV